MKSKKDYQKPELVDLNVIKGVQAACSPGTSDVVDCTAGGSALNACTAGTSAIAGCTAGSAKV